jgi:cob(I)alamin adenosyltransferase
MRIYTRTGDGGQTSLRWGTRIAKDAVRVEAYGTVDEANSFIGLALAQLGPTGPEAVRSSLTRILRELFDVGADLATPPDKEKGEQPKVKAAMIDRLEAEIDALDESLAPLRQFILPSGCPAGATLHVARTVVRRAERRVVSLAAAEPVDPVLVKYLNRLSDYLFVAARAVNAAAGMGEIKVDWQFGE